MSESFFFVFAILVTAISWLKLILDYKHLLRGKEVISLSVDMLLIVMVELIRFLQFGMNKIIYRRHKFLISIFIKRKKLVVLVGMLDDSL